MVDRGGIAEGEVELEIVADRCVNVAMQQNDVPVIRRLRIHNLSGEPLEECELAVVAEPAFAEPLTVRISSIQPGGFHQVDQMNLVLRADYLFEVTERLSGCLRATLSNGSTLAETSVPIQVLAANEWVGLQGLPELVAAFVVPNDHAVSRLLRQAAEVLREWGQETGLCGYQGNAQQIGMMVAGIYEALRRQDITYINPPASFETSGQKVRLPARILEEKLGTCLDLSLLMCSCLEQAGLHPLLILKQGHAFAGVWLHEETFPVPAVDEMTALTKRVELGEIVVFEPTAVTNGVGRFEEVIRLGRDHLKDEAALRLLIDIRRSRISRILPLPGRRELAPEDTGAVGEGGSGELELPEFTLPSGESGEALQEDAPATRLEHWRNRLLDLSLRNRLLNFRDSKKTLPVLGSRLAALEDGLATGSRYEISPKPKEFRGRDTRLHRQRTGEDGVDAMLADELDQGRVYVDLTDKELEGRLLELFRAARTGLEETGVSGLFLALGFLRWYEDDRSETPRLAPILLLPVTLTRESVRSGFRLERSDDDAKVNVTLLELLKRDFELNIQGLAELPEDEAGLDVPKILQRVRRAIRDQPRWEVEERACVGLFVFTKFMMWLDLQERLELLKQNPVVAHLVDKPQAAFDPGASFPEPRELDDAYRPEDVYCPLGADSTQLAAVLAAAEGRSYVLQGPPGTGKSHTITNLICHCLATGKQVLFVSEKMAALNVVRSRLEQLGLGSFCLELHSNKANKKEVLRQFEESLRFGPRRAPEAWAAEAAQLAVLRDSLNDYVRALHRPRSNGWTAFDAVSTLVTLREAAAVRLSWPAHDAHTPDTYRELQQSVERLAVLGKTIGSPAQHPWFACGRERHSSAWQRDVEAALGEARTATESLRAQVSQTLRHLKLDILLEGEAQVQGVVALGKVLTACPDLPPPLLQAARWRQAQAELAELIDRVEEAQRLRGELEPEYEVDLLLEQDLTALQGQWRLSAADWLLIRWWKQRPVQKLLQAMRRTGTKPPGDLSVEGVLEKAAALQQLVQELADGEAMAKERFEGRWRGEASDCEELRRLLTLAEEAREGVAKLTCEDLDTSKKVLGHLAELLVDGADRFGPETMAGETFVALAKSWSQWQASWSSLSELAEIDHQRLLLAEGEPWLSCMMSCMERWRGALEELRDWCLWQKLVNAGREAGLGALLAACEEGKVAADDLEAVFTKSYLEWWYAAMSDEEQVLREFSSSLHEHAISKFVEVDERFAELTRLLVIARLSAGLPSKVEAANPESELGILRREIQKKTRHKSIRSLLASCRSIAGRLKPCMLMSPLSVAQYLGAGYPAFDLVVFDEASQIPVWDAIGAVGRAASAVVVGDPKQLPPTSFFTRVEDGESMPDDYVEDLESILDECLAGGLPELRLGWHYRSRHESLISFSNFHYYDNRLLTFPAADNEAMGVHLHHLEDGVYDRSKSRTNRVEAEAIVADIERRLRDPERRHQSIGVVTFSQAQQVLIEDLLDQRRAEQPELEFAFSDDRPERLFVKNLENVQGDERDVILFSICYGPDAQGRVSMNFGPLNQTGGERRLNVAITRARLAVHVYASLRGDQIDLTRTRAVGVQHLRAFLEYADRGAEVLGGELSHTGGSWDSPLEKQIGEALQARGWRIHRQVGCSGYRLDIAVLHPEVPGRYLLGIECDGAAYHSAASARDRDKLRQAVLEGLGWRIQRIWSTDWWHSPERELEKVEARLRELALEPVKRSPTAEPSPAKPLTLPDPVEATDAADDGQLDLPLYEAWSGEPFGMEAQFDAGAEEAVRASIEKVLEVEAPMAAELLVRRVAEGWQLSRLSKKRRQLIESQLTVAKAVARQGGETLFYWLPHQNPQLYRLFRTHPDGDPAARRMEEVCQEELANCARYVLQTQGKMPAKALTREVAGHFACNRVTRQAEEHVLAALRLLDEEAAE